MASKMSRRSMLRLMGAAAAGAVVTACGGNSWQILQGGV